MLSVVCSCQRLGLPFLLEKCPAGIDSCSGRGQVVQVIFVPCWPDGLFRCRSRSKICQQNQEQWVLSVVAVGLLGRQWGGWVMGRRRRQWRRQTRRWRHKTRNMTYLFLQTVVLEQPPDLHVGCVSGGGFGDSDRTAGPVILAKWTDRFGAGCLEIVESGSGPGHLAALPTRGASRDPSTSYRAPSSENYFRAELARARPLVAFT